MHFIQWGTYFARPDVADFTKIRPYLDEVARNRAHLPATFGTWLASGVTTVVDMGGPLWTFDVRDESRRLGAAAPDVLVAGPLISTEARPALDVTGDPPILKVTTEDEAERAALRGLERNPDVRKFLFIYHRGDDLAAQERLVRRVAQVAHSHGVRLAVHAMELDVAKAALRAGADILVHSIEDAEIDDELVALARANHATYTPTLFVMLGYALALSNRWHPTPEEERFADPQLLADLGPLDRLPQAALPSVVTQMTAHPPPAEPSAIGAHNLLRMWREGFLVTVGTDAGNIGTLHGPSYFRETALMAAAGLSPKDVLRAATVNGATLIKREKELGDVRAGMVADLVVLRADPLADVKNLAAIDAVVKDGEVVGQIRR